MFLKSHRAQVEALVRRADDLERRASNAAVEGIRKLESVRARALSERNAEQLRALLTVVEIGKEHLAALRELHRQIVETARSAPPTTRSERRRVRRDLKVGVAALERGVVAQGEGNTDDSAP